MPTDTLRDSPSDRPPRWQFARFGELAADDLYAALAARAQVFVVEQQCAFQDLDGLDAAAWHLLGWYGEGGACALGSYLRILPPGAKYAEPSIGRVLTVAPYRGTGQGRALMREGLARCADLYGAQPVRIWAQQRLEAFYASLGFRAVGAPGIEDGILHVAMLRPG